MKAIELNDAIIAGQTLAEVLAEQIKVHARRGQELELSAEQYPARSARKRDLKLMSLEEFAYAKGIGEAATISRLYDAMQRNAPIEETLSS